MADLRKGRVLTLVDRPSEGLLKAMAKRGMARSGVSSTVGFGAMRIVHQRQLSAHSVIRDNEYYDDRGWSGGNMQRHTLQQLLRM